MTRKDFHHEAALRLLPVVYRRQPNIGICMAEVTASAEQATAAVFGKKRGPKPASKPRKPAKRPATTKL